ncbi:Pleckstrin homology domain-containing family A member 5 [Labeo rohita]|uniref:Pleckstrin homology domain-containing family A member 5 n=1 Tax=Labeo rohita TaxID=84645 RepID=A0ABQ8MRY5_LABRO|nr:Pleckstrin homology domain-containing family A member 5 [Labeo rohita]
MLLGFQGLRPHLCFLLTFTVAFSFRPRFAFALQLDWVIKRGCGVSEPELELAGHLRPATKAPAAEKKERPTSTMSEASNYTGGSDYATHPSSPTTRLSRSSKKVHNFGKRSNSIKRNPNAPVVKNGWLYKQGLSIKRFIHASSACVFMQSVHDSTAAFHLNKADICCCLRKTSMRWNWAGLSVLHCDWSAGLIDGCCAAGLLQDSTGMKMWKKRWFVLSDMCLFYYRGESSICVMCLVFLYMHENIHLRALSDFCCGKWHVCAAVCGFCVAYFSNHGTVNMEMMLKEWLNYVCPSQNPTLQSDPLFTAGPVRAKAVYWLTKKTEEYSSHAADVLRLCPYPPSLCEPVSTAQIKCCMIERSVCCEPPAAFFTSERRLADLSRSRRSRTHRLIYANVHNASLFVSTDEKEEGILGSILLPSFHISMLSVDDHISRKYAFKATHPNMRTYYFSTDTAKDMESWMKVMTDASLVHSEPIRRLEKVKVDSRSPQEMNNMLNHRVLTRPEIQNNERNRETLRQEEKKQKAVDKQKEKDGRVSVQKDGERYTLQRDADNYALHKDAQRLALQKDGDRYMLQKDVEKFVLQKDGEKYAVHKEGEKYLLQKDGQKYTVHKDGDKYTLQREGEKYAPPKDGEKSLQKDARYPLGDKHVQQKDSEKPVPPPREGEKYGFQKEGAVERPLTKINSIKLQPAQAAAIAAAVSSSRQLQSAAGSAQYKPAQVNGSGERGGDRSPGDMNNTVPQRTTVPPQPAEPERTLSRTNSMQQLEQWVRTHRTRAPDDDTRSIRALTAVPESSRKQRFLSHSQSPDASAPQQTPIVPRYPEGYRTLPRNMLRPDSICSVAGSVYDRALPPATAEKRRSIRDDTMWQLYEWQQRQAHSRIGYGTLPSPKTMGQIAESIPTSPSHGSLAGYHTFSPNRPLNPDSRSEVSSPVFRGDYSYPAERRPVPPAQSITAQSLQGKTPEELTLLLIKLRRQQAELNSLREHTLAQLMQLNLDAANPKSEILSHHLQRNLMYLDSQMKENEPVIFMIHTMIENSAPRPQLYQQVRFRNTRLCSSPSRVMGPASLSKLHPLTAPSCQMSPEEYRENTYIYRPEELDIDAKLSQLCEQDKVVRTQEEKLQQLHREKHTLETALLSASQEIEMSSENPAAVQSVIQQRDVLQSGLLSTCREVSRVNAELERSWREYDRMEADVTMAKTNLLEQLEALGSPQTEPPSQKHVQIQKELWRIQDVMEALIKNKPKRNTEPSFPGANPLSNLHKSEESDSVPPRPPLPYSYEGGDRPPHAPRTTPHRPEDRKAAQRNGAHSGPDYRLYKSEPELTTVAEVDESNGEDKSEQTAEKETAGVNKGVVYPVGVVSPRTKSPMPESSTIASYVTLRKSKKPDPRTPQDRPRSAVEQMSSAIEVGRTRMSVEEQMERIRRHQQGALRERRREDGSLSRSLSFTKENTYYTLQRCTLQFSGSLRSYRAPEWTSVNISSVSGLLLPLARKKSPVISPDEQDDRRDMSPEKQRELTTKPTDAEENCKNTEDVESGNATLENKEKAPTSRTASIKEALLKSAGPKPVLNKNESEPKLVSPLEYRKTLAAQNSLQTAVMVRVDTEEDEEEDEEDDKPSSQEQDVSYGLTNSKHGTLMSVNSLSTPPQSPSSSSSPPPPPSPPQLTDGSHFINKIVQEISPSTDICEAQHVRGRPAVSQSHHRHQTDRKCRPSADRHTATSRP